MHTMTAKNYMTRNVKTFSPETPVIDAARELLRSKHSGAPVVDEQGRLLGMLSEADCLKDTLMRGYFNETTARVRESMSTEVQWVGPESNLVSIAELFVQDHRRRLPVVKDGKLVGIISRKDLLDAMIEMVDSPQYFLHAC